MPGYQITATWWVGPLHSGIAGHFCLPPKYHHHHRSPGVPLHHTQAWACCNLPQFDVIPYSLTAGVVVFVDLLPGVGGGPLHLVGPIPATLPATIVLCYSVYCCCYRVVSHCLPYHHCLPPAQARQTGVVLLLFLFTCLPLTYYLVYYHFLPYLPPRTCLFGAGSPAAVARCWTTFVDVITTLPLTTPALYFTLLPACGGWTFCVVDSQFCFVLCCCSECHHRILPSWYTHPLPPLAAVDVAGGLPPPCCRFCTVVVGSVDFECYHLLLTP